MRHILNFSRSLTPDSTTTISHRIPYDHHLQEIRCWFEPGSERAVKVYIYHGHRGTTDDFNLIEQIGGAQEYLAGDGNEVKITDLEWEGESNMAVTVVLKNEDTLNAHEVDCQIIVEERLAGGGA